MTPTELNDFYRELDAAERAPKGGMTESELAEYYAQAALEHADDSTVRILARLACRFAIRDLLRQERLARYSEPHTMPNADAEWRRHTRARKLTRTERLQAAADAGYDTWDDYKGDK